MGQRPEGRKNQPFDGKCEVGSVEGTLEKRKGTCFTKKKQKKENH